MQRHGDALPASIKKKARHEDDSLEEYDRLAQATSLAALFPRQHWAQVRDLGWAQLSLQLTEEEHKMIRAVSLTSMADQGSA